MANHFFAINECLFNKINGSAVSKRMKPIRSFFLLAQILLMSSPGFGQGFIAPVNQFPMRNSCTVELMNGSTVVGKVKLASLDKKGHLIAIALKDASGITNNYEAQDIKRLYAKMDFFAKMDAFYGSSSSAAEIFGIEFHEVMEREYIIYEQALLPKKKDKYRLLQLVNPGSDKNIKVYHNPDAKETKRLKLYSVALTGGKDRSYLVVVRDQKAIKLKKKKYKKTFAQLYGTCPKMIELMGMNKIKFKDMPAHIYAFDQLCEFK